MMLVLLDDVGDCEGWYHSARPIVVSFATVPAVAVSLVSAVSIPIPAPPVLLTPRRSVNERKEDDAA